MNYNLSKALDTHKFIFLVCCIYLISPLSGLFLLFLFTVSKHSNNTVALYFFFCLLALYIGLINSTKIPVTDQIMYYEAYKLVPQRNLWENLTGIYGTHGEMTTKEIGFGLFNFVGYYCTFGSYPLFITVFTFILYMLYYDAIYKWFNFIKVKNSTLYIISAVVTLTFFTQFFNITIHLQRQMIATAFIIYAITQTIVKNKVSWWIVILGFTMHTATGLFIPLFLILQFYKKIQKKQILLILLGFILLISSLNYIAASLLSVIQLDVYALNRLEKMGSSNEDAMSNNIIMLVSIPLVFISLRNLLASEKKIGPSNENILYLFYLFNVTFSVLNPDNTMQYRFFMMSYGFIPLILPLLAKKKSYEKAWLVIVPFFFFLRFFFTFEDIVFKYAPVEYIAFGNVFTLFNYNNVTH